LNGKRRLRPDDLGGQSRCAAGSSTLPTLTNLLRPGTTSRFLTQVKAAEGESPLGEERACPVISLKPVLTSSTVGLV